MAGWAAWGRGGGVLSPALAALTQPLSFAHPMPPPDPLQREFVWDYVKQRASVQGNYTNWAEALIEVHKRFGSKARALTEKQWQGQLGRARPGLRKQGAGP